MNNDLISRSALKEGFESRLALCNEWIEKAKDKETKIRADATKHFICEVIMTIDNAPTVEFPEQITIKCDTEEDKQKLLSAFRNARATRFVEDERPTGHWKALGFVHSRRYAWCTCSNCGKTTRIYLDDNDFCCIADIRKKAIACLYCGADMRKEAEND